MTTKGKTDAVDQSADTQAAGDTPQAEQTPAPALERPKGGGSYIRQADGSLKKREG